MQIRELEPKALWNHFSDLNAVPRASKKEERVIQFMLDFASSLGLESVKDKVGNVIIKKPATTGMEDRQTVVMQSHLDMVHQKNADTDFDFDREGIKMILEGDWIKADGTTLGADNGIGVATIMAILKSTEIAHPAIEALFTIDEETGMTGALGLEGGLLTGSILLNLDTEDDNELTIGCAGGVDVSARGYYDIVSVPDDYVSYKITVKGLSGGHSGMDIHKGLGNANKIMNRLMLYLSRQLDVCVSTIDGGGLRNAIPRESFCLISIANSKNSEFSKIVSEFETVVKSEHSSTDPNFNISVEPIEQLETGIKESDLAKLTKALCACANGIYRMSPDIEGLVQTSNNLARVLVTKGKYEILCLTRSSVDSEKDDLEQALRSTFELIGAKVTTGGAYPGWTPKPDAPIIKTMSEIYEKRFNEKPHVNACHAGLECGIIGTNYPNMDMISFGPNIRGAHSPDERVQVSSVQKYWGYLLEVLKAVPQK